MQLSLILAQSLWLWSFLSIPIWYLLKLAGLRGSGKDSGFPVSQTIQVHYSPSVHFSTSKAEPRAKSRKKSVSVPGWQHLLEHQQYVDGILDNSPQQGFHSHTHDMGSPLAMG